MYGTLWKGQKILYIVFSNCSTEHCNVIPICMHAWSFHLITIQLNITRYTVIPIWLTIDVYRMTKVNSTMTSREYMISQPPINQCSSLGGTWICMSKMCHEYAIAYCPLGKEIYWLKKRKIIWGILKLPFIHLSRESQGKKMETD